MALSDFIFITGGTTSAGATEGVKTIAHLYAANNSATGANQEAKAIPGEPIAHNSLSNPLSGDHVGTYCRHWAFQNSHTTNASQRSFCGYAIVKTGSASSLPITDTPSNGTMIAQSLRAFVRITGSATKSSAGAGSYVGLIARSFIPSHDNDYPVAASNYHDNYYGTNMGRFLCNGYMAILTTSTVYNYQGTAGTKGATSEQYGLTAPKIILACPPRNGAFTSDGLHNAFTPEASQMILEEATGTYAYDTWYHIRMDVIPSIGSDTVKIYTAPTSGAGSAAVEELGSETWTEVLSETISTSSPVYVPYGTSNHGDNQTTDYNMEGAGFCIGAMNNEATATAPGDGLYLDTLQYLTQDIS